METLPDGCKVNIIEQISEEDVYVQQPPGYEIKYQGIRPTG